MRDDCHNGRIVLPIFRMIKYLIAMLSNREDSDLRLESFDVHVDQIIGQKTFGQQFEYNGRSRSVKLSPSD